MFMAAIHGKSFTFDMVFVFLVLAIAFFGLAIYRVVAAKPWKPWQELLAGAFVAAALLVQFKF